MLVYSQFLADFGALSKHLLFSVIFLVGILSFHSNSPHPCLFGIALDRSPSHGKRLNSRPASFASRQNCSGRRGQTIYRRPATLRARPHTPRTVYRISESKISSSVSGPFRSAHRRLRELRSENSQFAATHASCNHTTQIPNQAQVHAVLYARNKSFTELAPDHNNNTTH